MRKQENSSDCPITEIKFIQDSWTKNYEKSPLEEDLGNLYEIIPWNGNFKIAFSKMEDQRPITSFRIDEDACIKSDDLAFIYEQDDLQDLFYPTEKLLFNDQETSTENPVQDYLNQGCT